MIPNAGSSGESSRDLELAHVALGILSFYAALVGAALGSLLPRPLGGVTLGCGLAVGVLTILPKKLIVEGGVVGEYVMWGPVLAVLGGVLATR